MKTVPAAGMLNTTVAGLPDSFVAGDTSAVNSVDCGRVVIGDTGPALLCAPLLRVGVPVLPDGRLGIECGNASRPVLRVVVIVGPAGADNGTCTLVGLVGAASGTLESIGTVGDLNPLDKA